MNGALVHLSLTDIGYFTRSRWLDMNKEVGRLLKTSDRAFEAVCNLMTTVA
jgi:hypothetical protein